MAAHTWKFFRAGGFDQVRLDTGADIKALPGLDPKLWVALACPTKGLEFDAHTLDLLDIEKDGRVRVPEVIAAVKWTCGLLKNPDELIKNDAALPLSSIDDSTDEGKRIVSSAKEILKNLGKPTSASISPADTTDTAKIFAKTLFNGDGVIPPESAEGDAATAAAIKDIIGCVGPDKDMSGLDGLSQAKLEKFFTEATAFIDWWKKAEGDVAVLPLKDATPAAWEAFRAVRDKVDDYFARCALAAMDARAAQSLNPPEAEYVALATKELSGASTAIAHLPLARIEPKGALPLIDGLNPAWASAVFTLRDACVKPLLGERQSLTAAEWAQVGAKLAGHAAWLATKPPNSGEKLGIARLKELVGGPARAAIDALMAKDKALEPEAKAIASVDRLAHYYRDLARFLNNFVAFKQFYTRKADGSTARAVFQAGTLYLDGRSAELVLKVEDIAKHAGLAGQSMACLAYCECVRKNGAEKLTIVAAFTDGDSDYLQVGRNGLFFDTKGQDWDATITKVIEQPISLRQAFWAPYKRLAKFVSDQIEKFAASRDTKASESLHGGVVEVAKAKEPLKPEAPAPFDIGKFAGIFAAIGLALGTIGAAAAAIMTGFLTLSVWQMPLAVVGAMLVISGPSVLLAAMKLRHRNLGPLLDAGGWAINSRARINIPFGSSLTAMAKLPPGAERSLSDPYADKKRPWGLYVTLLVLVGAGYWLYDHGFLARWWAALNGELPAQTAPKDTPDAGK